MRRRILQTIAACGLLAALATAPHMAEAASITKFAATTDGAALTQTTAKPSGTSRRGGVTISPAFQQVTLQPGQQQSSFEFAVTNNSDQEYEFSLSVVDFDNLDETGGVLFVGNAEKALGYRYALSPWVTLQKNRVVVAPKATEKIPITLTNKESLAPGGHYGAVLVSPTDASGTNGEKVQIDQVASSLLFVTKQGGERYKLQLNKFTVKPKLFNLPSSLNVRFQNSGNVHVTPRGIATLTDPRGRIVKRGIVNADSGIVLPESFRSARVTLDNISPAYLPGRYTLDIAYRYDGSEAVKHVTTKFVYLNLPIVLLAAALIGGIIAVLVSDRLRRRIGGIGRSIWSKRPRILKRK